MKLARSNDELVEYMKKHGMVKTPAILEAFRAVDRGDFATPHLGQVAYLNRPIQDGDVHLSAPFIYADALEELNPKPGMSFLNIGSGTGYLSYLVSMLVGELGVNHGVEINKALLEHSARCIATTDDRLGRKTDIQLLEGNGLDVKPDLGYDYDCVYVGAGCDPDLTLPYLQGLLNVKGVMVAPFREELVRVERMEDGSFTSRTLSIVCFSPIAMPADKKDTESLGPSPVRFVVKPWSPLCHSVYPRSFRDAVVTVLMANGRDGTVPGVLPPALWMEIMGFARRDWFSEAAIGQKREAKTKAKRDAVAAAAAAGKGIEKAGGSGSAGDNGSGISRKSVYSACLGAAATQVGCHVS
ncbi:unnamed protein product [Pylaiella littoralis]